MTTPTLLPLAPLATAAQLSDFMGSAAPSVDAAELLLAAASSMVRRYCGWHIFPVIEEEDRVVNARGGSVLGLPTLCLLDISALALKSSTTNEWEALTEDELAALDWSQDGWIDRRAGFYRASCGLSWPNRTRSVRLSMTHGFADAYELQQLVLTMCARATATPTGALSQAIGAVSLSYSPGPGGGPAGGITLYDDQRQMLDAYRLFGRP